MVWEFGCKPISYSIKSRFYNFRTGPKPQIPQIFAPAVIIVAVCPSLAIGLSFPKWDCINARQRKTTKVAQLKACASLLTSQSQAHTAAKAAPLPYAVLNSLLDRLGA